MRFHSLLTRLGIITLLFLVGNCGINPAFSQTPPARPPSQQELDQIDQAISEIQSWLDQATGNKPEYEQQLEDVELQIGSISAETELTRQSIRDSETAIEALQQQISALNQAKEEQAQLIEQVVRAAYMEGRQSYLKLVLNQQDAALAARMLQYYQKFNAARLEQIREFQNTLTELALSQQRLLTENQELEIQQGALAAQLSELDQTRSLRQQALAQLNADISFRNTELERLLADRETLQQLINQIHQSIENLPRPGVLLPIAELKGKLPRPGPGELLELFGSSYGSGNLQRQGILIASESGKPVQAVHGGRVVFSDWLRGSGLLLIIDHGEGHMSLYGHNESLIRSKGNWVNAGDIIATAGNSGGYEKTGIYFEMRVNGRPQDPQQWLIAPQ